MKHAIPIIVIATILSLLGCTKTVKDDPAASVKKSVSDFKYRPIHRKMTLEIIDETPDDQLLQTIFDNLSEKIAAQQNKEYQTVASWNKSRQTIYIIWCLEGEVNNGGFNQFYFNSSGQFAAMAPDALQLVGAKKFSDLARQANQIYRRGHEKITKSQDGTLEGLSKSYDENPLNDLDEKFYNLYKTEDLQSLQIVYIRKNKTEFID